MRVTFAGCGDAFGSGGRFNTCFHVETRDTTFLIDCGASSLIALKKLGIDLNAIDTILVTHFHADHFGGIPFFMLDAQFFAKRRQPLTIAGPAGLQEWYRRVMETSFPGSSETAPKFDLTLRELYPGGTAAIGPLAVTPAAVRHGPPDGSFFAYRVAADGRSIAYTGDTEWTDALIPVARDADLFIAEAYFHDKKVPLHLDLATLESQLDRLAPKRLILTHMNDDMLSRLGTLPYETADDGMRIEL